MLIDALWSNRCFRSIGPAAQSSIGTPPSWPASCLPLPGIELPAQELPNSIRCGGAAADAAAERGRYVTDFTGLMRVLVADDNQAAAASLAILLRLWGYKAHVVHDGLSALQATPRFQPHVALLDIEMPKMHGGEVARRLRLLRELGKILIVATTGTEPQDQRLTGYAGVFDSYLPKPYNLERLESLLGTCATEAGFRHSTGRR